jgi:hypothetical protein
MLERDLSSPCELWLLAEVPLLGRCVDWIATDLTAGADRICCVEMKLGLTRVVIRQAYMLQLVTPDVWCFVGTKPRDLSRAVRCGLGVAWFDGRGVHELLQPAARLTPNPPYAAEVRRRTAGAEPGGVSGCPTRAGVGPAQTAYELAARYRGEHPGASWREVWAAVPNHYANPRSMQQSMRFVEERREVARRPRVTYRDT